MKTCGGDRTYLNCVSRPVYPSNTIILQLSSMEYCLETEVMHACHFYWHTTLIHKPRQWQPSTTTGQLKFRLKIHITLHFQVTLDQACIVVVACAKLHNIAVKRWGILPSIFLLEQWETMERKNEMKRKIQYSSNHDTAILFLILDYLPSSISNFIFFI